jgi:hypothetical protein
MYQVHFWLKSVSDQLCKWRKGYLNRCVAVLLIVANGLMKLGSGKSVLPRP